MVSYFATLDVLYCFYILSTIATAYLVYMYTALGGVWLFYALHATCTSSVLKRCVVVLFVRGVV